MAKIDLFKTTSSYTKRLLSLTNNKTELQIMPYFWTKFDDMGFFSFNKRTKHRSFDYMPRYYDPEKEHLQDQRKKYGEHKDDVDMAKQRIKSGFKNRYRADQSFRSKQVSKSNIRLITIILILVFLSYLFLQSDGLLKMLESFTNG